MEAFFWGQEADSNTNFHRYLETLDVIRKGLNTELLTYDGRFHSFESLPMRLGPVQRPYPPMWYMRNAETAALEGMNTVIVGTLDSLRRKLRALKKCGDRLTGKDHLRFKVKSRK